MDKTLSSRRPSFQAALILLILPGLYVAKDELGLVRMIVANLPQWMMARIDRPGFIVFWSTVLLLHYAGVFLVFRLLKFNGLGPQDIGLKSTQRQVAIGFSLLLCVGIAFALFRSYASHGDFLTPLGRHLPDIYAINFFQRCCWVVISLSAGFCEELVYRGFGINMLARVGVPVWAAVTMTSLSFAFIHGLGAPLQLVTYFGAGVVFSLIYLRSKNLLPAMLVHSGYDLTAILVQ